MKSVNYFSHLSQKNIQDINAAALYFDQIIINEFGFYHPDGKLEVTDEFDKSIIIPVVIPFTQSIFKETLKIFENHGIIKYKVELSKPEDLKNIVLGNNEKVSELIGNNLNLIGAVKETKLNNGILEYEIDFNEEAKYLLDTFLNKDERNGIAILLYYGRLLNSFINSFSKGRDVLSSSKFINEIFPKIDKSEKFQETVKVFKSEFSVVPDIPIEALKINLPDLGNFPCEEILNFKEKSKDELIAFRETLDEITFDFLSNYSYSEISKNAQQIVNVKINPLVRDISKSLERNRSNFVLKILAAVQDPKSYTPLVLTLAPNIPGKIALMVSAGIISLKTGLEQYIEDKEIKNKGVYYLYKAKKHFG